MIATIREKARSLKAELNVLVIAYRDPRTPLIAKLLIAATVAYVLSPIDLIPDFIPVLGLLDDLLIVPVLISVSIKMIPIRVLDEARARAAETPLNVQRRSWIVMIAIIAIWISVAILLYMRYGTE